LTPASVICASRWIACGLLPLLAVANSNFANAEPTTASKDPHARLIHADREPHNWLSHGRTPAEQRFSPLDRIRPSNIAKLGLAWSYETRTRRGLEATPLVVDGVLYATGTWSVVYALDAKSGRELWRYDPKVAREVGRKACCDVVNRGVAYFDGRIYLGVLDGRLLALDAKSGKLVWEVMTVDPSKDYTITGAPRIVKGKVIIGNGGAEFGVRGYFGAFDARTGSALWRFYTVPGDPALPYEHPELEAAAKTWSKDSMWEAGLGGTVWDAMAYDPELDLLYIGVGNSAPYNREVRSPGGGDNLFLSSILALRPDTGRLVWHYQTTPGENWDYTATQHMILAELEIAGRERKVLMQAPKNGFFYVLDRATGELISAEKLQPINWASHVDLATGRPVETGDGDWAESTAFVVPSVAGVHNWHPMSYSPRTGLVYIPTLSNMWPFKALDDFRHRPGQFNTGEDFPGLASLARFALNVCDPSHLTAWDPVAGRRAWRVEHAHPSNAGVLSTATDLVFQGRGDGAFVAYHAATGAKLWESPTGVGIMAAPISYAVDGEQYIAVLAGLGGSLAISPVPLENRNDGRLLAYKLGGKAKLPADEPRVPAAITAQRIEASKEVLARGSEQFHNHCARCHGFNAQAIGPYPDLRESTPAVHEAWDAIVLRGALRGNGMAAFSDVLSAADSRAIHAYVVDRALHEPGLLDRVHAWALKNACVPLAIFAN
jgi:quinohemoprotein ethanol dehydrogenase